MILEFLIKFISYVTKAKQLYNSYKAVDKAGDYKAMGI